MELNKIYQGDCLEVMKTFEDKMNRDLSNGGVVVWVVVDATIEGSETGTSFKQALYFKEIGFNLHDTMILCLCVVKEHQKHLTP